jgi:integrase
MTNTLGIAFLLRKNSNNRAFTHLYVRLSLPGERIEMAIMGPVDPTGWQASQEAFVGVSAVVKEWNQQIAITRFQLQQHFRRLTEQGQPVTALAVKRSFTGGIHPTSRGYKVLQLIDYHNKINPDQLKGGTMKNYSTTREYVKLFIEQEKKREDYYLMDLDFQFITELEYFIRTRPIKTHDPCTGNGAGKHMERFCKMIRLGKKLQWMKTYPFADYSPKFTKVNTIQLRQDELNAIEALSLSSPSLVLVQDLFLFSCYTGLAYCDVMKFGDEDLTFSAAGKAWIETYRQKSVEFSPVPLLSPAILLIEKYRNDPRSLARNKIFPYASNQEVNKGIKTIAKLAGIQKYLSFHKARHTFASAVTLKNGVPVETVQQMMGHKKISTTMLYAKVDEEKIQRDMDKVEQKLRKPATTTDQQASPRTL